VDEEHLGAFFQLLEFQTAFVGEMLGIDAFDQPGVEAGKKFTFGLMGRRRLRDLPGALRQYEKRRAKVG